MLHPQKQVQVPLPIACRFVAMDQWLVAHFDTSWKVAEVKQYILSKASTQPASNHFSFPPRHRPVSPITFASISRSRRSIDNPSELSFDLGDAFDDDSDLEIDSSRHLPSKPLIEPTSSPLTAHATTRYALIMFSTGQLMEDDYSLSWYQLRPYELLELHPPGAIVRLPRENIPEYVKPYFEARVKALRVIWTEKELRAEKDRPRPGQSPADTSPVIRKRKKTKLEWRERWIIIHQGMLNLFKDRSSSIPIHSSPLSSLQALRNAEDVLGVSAGTPQSSRVVCAKFAPAEPTYSPDRSYEPPVSPVADAWHDPWTGNVIESRESEDGTGPWSRRGSKDDTFKGHKERRWGSSGESRPDSRPGIGSVHDIPLDDDTQGIWVILDMLEDVAYANFLRILHRHAPDSVSSTFVPNKASAKASTSGNRFSPASAAPLPYPEWRRDVAERAQRAGMGDIGQAMSYIKWGDKRQRTLSVASTERMRRPSVVTRDADDELHGTMEFGSDDGGDSDEGLMSELEWDAWMQDLERQSRVRAQEPASEPLTPFPHLAESRRLSRPHSAVSSPSSIQSLSPHTPGKPASAFPNTMSSIHSQKNRPYSPLALDAGHGGLDPFSALSPALLTAHSVIHGTNGPLTGTTTSTVSAGGVVRARSLASTNEDGRGRNKPQAMEILREDGSAHGIAKKLSKSSSGKKMRDRKDEDRDRDRDREKERSRLLSDASAVQPLRIVPPSSSMQPTFSPMILTQDDPSDIRRRLSAVLAPSSSFGSTAGSLMGESSSFQDAALEVPDDGDSKSSGSRRTEGEDKANRRNILMKGVSHVVKRTKAFSPERLVREFDSALDFVDGR